MKRLQVLMRVLFDNYRWTVTSSLVFAVASIWLPQFENFRVIAPFNVASLILARIAKVIF